MTPESIEIAGLERAAGEQGPAPGVSIVIPCRNEAAFIRECLQSILDGDCGEPYEVIVADGRSTDGTPDLVRSLAAREGRLRLLDNPGRTTPAGLKVVGQFEIRRS
jgi:cellulose synthase/poly-beta-1,6-N-acetylglucosamine synthase-like glycosyltransferase